MAKKQPKLMVLKDNTTNEEWPILSRQAPRGTEPGVAIQWKVNHKGLHWFKQNKGIDITNVKDMNEIMHRATGMPLEYMGAIDNWKTPEEKAKYTVTISDLNGNNTINWADAVEKRNAEKEDAPQELVENTPKEPVLALADKSPVINQEIVQKIIEYVNAGEPDDKIKNGLIQKFGDETVAKAHYLEAKKILDTPKEEPVLDLKF